MFPSRTAAAGAVRRPVRRMTSGGTTGDDPLACDENAPTIEGACPVECDGCEQGICEPDDCEGNNCPLGTACNPDDGTCHCGDSNGPRRLPDRATIRRTAFRQVLWPSS